MTYSPGSPGSSGYPPAPPPGSYGAPTGPYGQTGPVTDPGPSKLPQYLTIAVVVLGLAAYLASFGPVFSTPIAQVGAFTVVAYDSGTILMTLAAVLASLVAAVSLLPKVKDQSTLVAILSVIGVLVVLGAIFTKDSSATIGWALWLVLAFTVLQAAAAITVLLYTTEVLTPPAPKPRYEQHYNQYGGQYTPYGAPGGYYGAPSQPTNPPAPPPPPRPGYPSQYGSYPSQQPTVGFGGRAPQDDAQHGPPTPPTGFPSFSPPPAVSSGQSQSQSPEGPGSGQHEAPSQPSTGPSPS